MKGIKRIICMLLTMTMVLAMASAFAEMGSITINNVIIEDGEPKATYAVYRMLDLDSYDPNADDGKGVYSYKVNTKWKNFFTEGAGQDYITVRTDDFVEWKGNQDNERVEGFAKLALAYAKENGITPEASSDTIGEDGSNCSVFGANAIKFSELPIGYYLVDSSIGALCGLTTTNPDISITAKNVAPTISKQVQEDSTSHWDKSNTAEIGELVNFRVTINVHDGAEKLWLHDKMSEGLTFNKVERIEHTVTGKDGEPDTHVADPATKYEVLVGTDVSDGCTFEVKLKQAFSDALQTNDVITVYYSAYVNENAIIGGNGTPNEAWLKYGDEHTTTHDTTQTYTYGFDLVKTNSQHNLLDGASFKIYNSLTGGKEISVVATTDENGNTIYRRATNKDLDIPYDVNTYRTEGGAMIDVTNGLIRLEGFDTGTYFLEEINWPDGYNPLMGRQSFTIGDSNKDATFVDGKYVPNTGIQVVNNAGTVLPSTGGIGTTLFYVFGGILAVAAIILLVTKKRMNGMD